MYKGKNGQCFFRALRHRVFVESKKRSSQGNTVENALEMITDAIMGYLEVEGEKKKAVV